MYALWHRQGPARHETQRLPRPPAHPPPPPTRPSTHHTGRRPPKPHVLRVFWRHRGPARHKAPGKNVHPDGRRNDTSRSTTQPQRSGSTRHHLPGGEPCPAKRIRRPQAPGPSNPSAPCARKRAQARAPQATRVHIPKHHPTRRHAATCQQPRHGPTRSPTHTTARNSDRRQAPHTHCPTALPHRHVPVPRPTPSAPGPSDPSAPCAPTPTSSPGAPVPRLQRHPARRPQGTIRRPRHKPNWHPNNATTHQPDRQYGPRKHHLAVTRPPARTRTRTRRTPPSWLTPHGQKRQATSSRYKSRVPRAEHRQQGPPRQREVATRGHWQATWEASPDRHPCEMVKPERRPP